MFPLITPPHHRKISNCARNRIRQNADNVAEVLIAEVHVDLRRPYRLVSQQLLDRPDVPGSHHQIARESVPPRMQARVLNLQFPQQPPEVRLQGMDVQLFSFRL